MKYTNAAVGGLVLLLATQVISAELPEEGKFDVLNCYSGTSQVLNFDRTHIAWGYRDEVSFTYTDPPGGPFDRMWGRCVGSGGFIEGERMNGALCEYSDIEGDSLFMTSSHATVLETSSRRSEVKLLAGTGKYQGLKGEGTSADQVFFPEDEDRPDSYAGCVRYSGTYQLSE